MPPKTLGSILIGILLSVLALAFTVIYLYTILDPVYIGLIISAVIISVGWWTHLRITLNDQSR